MSYRGIKRLLGETSLERKCRFLFGGGLMLLITGSFYFYGRLNSSLVFEQNMTTARLLISPIILEKHWKWAEDEPQFIEIIEQMADDVRPEDLREYSWSLLKADPSSAEDRPFGPVGYDALERLAQGESEFTIMDREAGEYLYFGAVRATKSCLTCHYHERRVDQTKVAENDLIAMVKISFPLERTEKALAWNNAILLATAIVTAFLAMLAAYAIVRYVIVKPVLHLKDVSDAIARGNLNLRADIRTGDEFEELSHAFNRMLRHLVNVQDELRNVNTDLDGKVDELAQVNLRLYEMNKLKDEFLTTMTHELRTPLNSILGFSDLLSGAESLTDQQKRFVRNIETSGKNLLSLITDVLNLAKIESGKMELHLAEFSLQDVVEQQVYSMQPLAEKKNIELGWNVSADLPILLQDSGKLQQILQNLLSNAVKFTPEGGRVQVTATQYDAQTIEIVVADTGVGIPLEEQATIFEKFRQGKAPLGQQDALTREYEGTGLGLSIVKELCKLLGGEILLESEFGKGSTFTIRIPILLEKPLESIDTPLPPTFPLARPTPLPGKTVAAGGRQSEALSEQGDAD